MMEGKKQTAEPARSRPRPDEGRRAGEGTTVREELVRRLARSVAVRWETPDAVLGRGVEPRTAEPRRVLRHEFRILACSESVAKPRTGPGGRTVLSERRTFERTHRQGQNRRNEESGAGFPRSHAILM